jgi:hypothetical protein
VMSAAICVMSRVQYNFAAILAAAAPLATLLWLSGSVTLATALGAMLVFAAVIFTAGVLLLRLAHAQDMPPAAAWVLGVFASALAVYALVQWLHLLAATAFAVWTAAVLAWAFASRKRPSAPAGADWRDLAGLALCAAATLTWCWQVADAPQILAREGSWFAWIDYFIHGGVISHFGDLRAGRQSIYLADFPAGFYHYASYMLPAAFAVPLDLPGLPLATSLWLPLGFFTLCAGAYTLGCALAGPAGGIAALAALTMLPDASNYWLGNGFFSFHWHLLSFPGASYAVGVLLLAVALLHRWLTLGAWRSLVASACLAGGTLLFRVHLFALGLPALLASAALATRFAQRRTLLSFGVALVGFAAFVWSFYALTDSAPALEPFLDAVHMHQQPTAYTAWYAGLLEAQGRGVAVPAGMALVLVASLGVLLVLYPLALLVVRRSEGLQTADLIPAAFLGCYVLIMLTAPTVKWDPTELTVRPFLILYAVLAVWTFAAFARWASRGGERRARNAWWALVLLSCLALVLVWPQTGKLGLQPKFFWGWRFYPIKVQPGVLQAGAFLRRNSVAGDVLAVRGLPLRWAATDLAIQLVSLSGMPAYLGYAVAQVSDPGERRRVALERYGALREVDAAPSPDEGLRRLRELDIQWYVTGAGQGPQWDPDRRHAAFVEGSIAVYRTGRR